MTDATNFPITPHSTAGSPAGRLLFRIAFLVVASGFSAATLLGQCAPNTLGFTNQGVPSGAYQALTSITADAAGGSGATIIGNGDTVTFQAGASITLLPSFHAMPGSSFQASVAGAAPTISPTSLSLLGGGGVECATVMVAPGVSWSASSSVSPRPLQYHGLYSITAWVPEAARLAIGLPPQEAAPEPAPSP